jgi:hypothetical protein
MTYTYRFASLLSDADLTELELSNVKFDRRIIVPGSFTASFVVSNADLATEVRKVVPGKTIVHVYRDADIWGSYIIWQVRIKAANAGNTSVEFAGASLESWFYRRIIDIDSTYTNVDQIDIFRDLVLNAQIGWSPYVDSANLNISVQDGSTGVLRDRVYLLSEAASVGQRVEELANVDNGFEYMIKTYVDSESNTRVREMSWGYPDINSTQKAAMFEYPGNISSYDMSYDSTEAATAFWTRGDSIDTDVTEDAQPLIIPAPYLSTTFLDGGWPHLDKVIDYSSVTDLTTLQNYAKWWRDNHAGLVFIPQIEINASELSAPFSPNELGGYATFTIRDHFFPLINGEPTFSGQFRIVGIEVTPPERGRPEIIRFVVETDFDPTDAQFENDGV